MRARPPVTAAALLLAIACQRDPEPLPTLGAIPELSLVDQDSRPFTVADLRDHVTVVSFFFTSCPSICPALTQKMAGLQTRLASASDVHFVSISVDPDHDTPERLARYAERFHADPARWRFVTGDQREVERVVTEGFKTALGERTPAPAGEAYDIVHSGHFVLVDRAGQIRGYYRTDTEGLDRLAVDVERLRREEGS